MSPKRSLTILGGLILVLFALDFGVNAALDHIAQSPTQSSFVIYDDQGNAFYAYNGDLNNSTVSVRPMVTPAGPRFLHRT